MLCVCGLSLATENWLPVWGYPNYMVSDLGRIKSLERRYKDCTNRVQWIPERILSIPTKGYPSVSLGKHNKRRIHILVLEAFVSPRPDDLWGLHKDDDRFHNHVNNLYWGTPTQNVYDSIRNGKHSSSKR